MTNDKKKTVLKKPKKVKKPKPKTIRSGNTININIGTGAKDVSKTGKASRPKQSDIMKNPYQNPYATGFFNTQRQQPAPPPPLRPEPDYRKLAETYLVKEPDPVKNHLLLRDVSTPKKSPIKTMYRSPIKIKKTPRPKKGTAVFHTFEDLMKVKTLKELKEIFKTSGIVTDEMLGKFTRQAQKGDAIRAFLEAEKKLKPANDDADSDNDDNASDIHPIMMSDDQTASSIPFAQRLVKYGDWKQNIVNWKDRTTPPRYRGRASTLPAGLPFQDQAATTGGAGILLEEL